MSRKLALTVSGSEPATPCDRRRGHKDKPQFPLTLKIYNSAGKKLDRPFCLRITPAACAIFISASERGTSEFFVSSLEVL